MLHERLQHDLIRRLDNFYNMGHLSKLTCIKNNWENV
jgi:hypothetical protein